MKNLIYLILLLNPALSFANAPSAKICAIMADALFEDYEPRDLCNKYGGSFCSSMELMGQAVCAANGESFCSSYETEGEALCEAVDGRFCSSVETVTGGICSILGESFCDDEEDDDYNFDNWVDELAEACFW